MIPTSRTENATEGRSIGATLATTIVLLALSILLVVPRIAAAASTAYLERNAPEFAEKIKKDFGEMVGIAALLHDYDEKLVLAVIVVESEGKHDAVSYRGAQGLMQLMPVTARAMGAKNPKEPFQNILAGTKYLKELERSYGFDSPQAALVAYNMGPSRAKRWLSQYDPEEYGYVQKVMYVYQMIVEDEKEQRRLADATEKKIAQAMQLPDEFKPLFAKPRSISLSSVPMTLPFLRRSQGAD